MAKTLDMFRAAHDPTFEGDSPIVEYKRPIPKDRRVFIVTAAQNSTPVHAKFWAILNNIAVIRNAEILVIPLRYKNPTSQWTGSQQNAEHWAEEVRPYLWNVRHALNANLTVLGDMKIQPTASSPLTANEGLSLASSGIVGHTKVQTKSVPTPQSKMAKLMMTSGACTVENYTDSRAGRVGEFHHSISAVLVEIEGKRFYARRLHYSAKSNSVIDLGTCYTAKTSDTAPRALGLVMGDTHVDFVDGKVVGATFGIGGIVERIRPSTLVWHDLLDAYSCNPHHKGDPFIAYAKRMCGRDQVRAEVDRAIEFVRKYTALSNCESRIVASNHDDFLGRWLKTNDWREDPTNAEFYLESALAVVRRTRLSSTGTRRPSPFAYWFEQAKVPNARCLRADESLMLGGIECGYHFDKGPNGARGSIRNMRRIGVKTVGGHSHSPGEDEGATQAGTSTRLTAEYTSGPSSWLNAHVSIDADGKRQLIVMVDGEFTTR